MKSKSLKYLMVFCIVLMMVFSFGIVGCDTDDDVVDDDDAIVDDPDDDGDDVAEDIPYIFQADVGGVTVKVIGFLIFDPHPLLGVPLLGAEMAFINNSDAPVTAYPEAGVLDTCLEEGVAAAEAYSGKIPQYGTGATAAGPLGEIAPGETLFGKPVWILQDAGMEWVKMTIQVGDDYFVAEFDDLDDYREE